MMPLKDDCDKSFVVIFKTLLVAELRNSLSLLWINFNQWSDSFQTVIVRLRAQISEETALRSGSILFLFFFKFLKNYLKIFLIFYFKFNLKFLIVRLWAQILPETSLRSGTGVFCMSFCFNFLDCSTLKFNF